MNRCDDRGKPLTLQAHYVRPNGSSAFLCAERLSATNSEEGVHSSAYGQLMMDSLRINCIQRGKQGRNRIPE